jgi:putative endonuclease
MADKFAVYILQSQRSGRYYVGETSNVGKRLHYHRSGRTKAGRNRGPWHLVYVGAGKAIATLLHWCEPPDSDEEVVPTGRDAVHQPRRALAA